MAPIRRGMHHSRIETESCVHSRVAGGCITVVSKPNRALIAESRSGPGSPALIAEFRFCRSCLWLKAESRFNPGNHVLIAESRLVPGTDVLVAGARFRSMQLGIGSRF